jgi:hypothetical protein
MSDRYDQICLAVRLSLGEVMSSLVAKLSVVPGRYLVGLRGIESVSYGST